MVDKVIGELPAISSLDDNSLFVAEQSGQAVKVSGKQLTDFSNVETNAQVEQAKASAQAAKTAQTAAEAAILKGPIIQNGTWWVYNQTAGAYQDTGIKATGPQGIPGPTSSVNGISPDSSGNITLTAGNINAYSKTEADALLHNNDPRQWGLGLNGPPATDDCDTATKNGWYHVYGATLNKPFGQVGALLVVCRESTQIYQLFFVGETYSTGGSCIIVRSMYGGTWGPWEWVNPPMIIGKEYRTTERFHGSPVYAQLFDCSPLPNATTKVFPVEGNYADEVVNIVVDYGGMSSYFGQSLQNKGFASINVTQSKIYIMTENDLSAGNAYVWVKYTKW